MCSQDLSELGGNFIDLFENLHHIKKVLTVPTTL